MKKKLLELLNKKQGIVNRMKSTNEAGDTAGFAAAQNELADVDAEIARVQAIMDAEASVPGAGGRHAAGAGRAVRRGRGGKLR